MLRTLSFPLTVLFLASAAAAQMGTSVDRLKFRVADAEFSKQLNRIVAISDNPTESLHLYDPVAGSGASVRLTRTGKCVSVSPDGTKAAVGHDGWLTYIDLRTVSIISTIPVSADVSDIVLAGNGFAYCFPASGQWTNIYCIELATKRETKSTGFSVRHGTVARLHPNGTKIYGADNGLSPSDIEKYDIAPGTANYLYDSPYHGTYSMAGKLWIAEDGQRIFVRGGNVFRSSNVRASDMVYNGKLSNLSLVQWAEHATSAGKVLAIPETPLFGGNGNDTQLQVYDYAFLGHEQTYTFPTTTVNGSAYPNHGRFVFFEASGNRAWALVRLDPRSGALLDDGIVRFDLKPTRLPLGFDVESISITAGGTQTMSLDAGPQYAGHRYFLLGSLNGTVPGIPVDGVVLPLNFEPAYFWHTFAKPNAAPLSNSQGSLDPLGKATARFVLGANTVPASLVGLSFHHAYLLSDGRRAVFASNAVPLRLTR